MADQVLGALFPGLDSATSAEHQANIRLAIARLAAALAVYRVAHGEYPNNLSQIVPDIVPELPIDLFSSKSFRYKPTSDGYLLYSVGENGIDDGGSSWVGNHYIFEGRSIDELNDQDLPHGVVAPDADDIAIRVPRPPFKLPTLAPPTDTE
jgi:hypothetical protein